MFASKRAAGLSHKLSQARQFSVLKREFAKAKRGVALLRDETRHAVGLLRKGKFDTHDVHIMTKALKDCARVVPILGVLALPGGSLAVPFMAKAMPWALPSTFTYVEKELNPTTETKATTRDFVNKTFAALGDLRGRLVAQPQPEPTILDQIDAVLKPGDANMLIFANIYNLSEQAIADMLDEDALHAIASAINLKESQSLPRKKLIKSIISKVADLRAGDLALQDALEMKALDPKEIQIALDERGLRGGDKDTLEAWLDITVVRSLPVMLLLLGLYPAE